MADALGAVSAMVSGAKAMPGREAMPGVEMLGVEPLQGGAAAGAVDGQPVFSAILNDAIAQVEAFQSNSQNMIGDFLAGKDVELHQVALGVQKAETAFELFAEVRNKVVAAYQEVMRMQV